MDEAQFDCPSDIFSTHYFTNEDEAEEAKLKYKNSSTVGHIEDQYYFTEENVLSQFINEEIYRVCMDLDLRVPLGMEYITGTNWCNCH